VVDLALAKTMGCEGGTRWLQISSLRMDGGKKLTPICWTNVYVDPSYADIADMVRASPQALISAFIAALNLTWMHRLRPCHRS
jgi:GntR family transcriptional regulator